MLDAVAAEILTRSFLLGTARQPPPIGQALAGLVDPAEDKAALKALALLGQHQRFLRHPANVTAPATPLFADPRALPPPAVRAGLVSLLTGKNGRHDDVVAAAVADALAQRKLRLHPFDLPRLDAFAKEYRDMLGASAVAWAERHASTEKSEDPEGYFFIETIDESNWRKGRPAQKAAFIRDLRRTEPDRARELLVAAFPSEPAAVRLGLVSALIVRLTGQDQPFLEGLAKDRAPTVREAAEAMLARLPGSPQSQARLAEVIGRIKVAKAGIFRQRRKLTLEFPATVRDWQRENWARATFAGLGLDTVAAALGMDVEDLPAASEDAALSAVLATRALIEGRFSLLAKFEAGKANVWAVLDRPEDLDLSSEDSADALVGALVQSSAWKELPSIHYFAKLYLVTHRQLQPQLFKQLLASGAWRLFRDRVRAEPAPHQSEMLHALAALAPASERAALRAELAPFDLAIAGRAGAALDLLDLIDAA